MLCVKTLNMVDIDPIDIKILRMLINDGRISYSQIAKEVKISDVAVKKRIEKLMGRGIIKKITAVVDRERLGLKYTYYLMLRVEPSHIFPVFKKLSDLVNVLEVSVVAGEYPLFAKMVGESIDEIKKTIKEIGKMEGITDIKTMVALEIEEKTLQIPAKIGQKVLQ